MPIILDPTTPGPGPTPPATPQTPTLAQIEVAVARRLGPFYYLAQDAQSPSTGTQSFAYVPELQTLIDQDLVPNLYILRRGLLTTGAATPIPVPPNDRVRTVYSVDASNGRLIPDRPWQWAPFSSEQFEIHHLHPDMELRPTVLSGLRRCFFEDRVQLEPGYYYEYDVTAALPYVTDASQIRRAQVGPWPSGWPGWWRGPLELPFAAYGQGAHIWIRISGSVYWGPFWGGVLLTLHRDHFGFVNGKDAPDGPQNDTDVLYCPLDWAAAAGHVEAWVRYPARLQAAAATGLQASKQEAAAELQRQGYLHRLPIYDPIQFDRTEMWGLGGGTYVEGGGRRGPVVVNS